MVTVYSHDNNDTTTADLSTIGDVFITIDEEDTEVLIHIIVLLIIIVRIMTRLRFLLLLMKLLYLILKKKSLKHIPLILSLFLQYKLDQ